MRELLVVYELLSKRIKPSPWRNTITYTVVVIGTICALYAQAFFRSRLFIYGSWDTAFYLQAFWNLANLKEPTSTLNDLFPTLIPINIFMGHHFQYSAILFAPLFRLGQSPLAIGLYVIPALTLALVLYFWCKLFRKPEDLLPGTVALIALLWAPNGGLFSSEFYFDKFVTPWVVASLYFYLERRFLPLVVALVIVTGFKEYFAMFASVACLLYWHDNRSNKAMISAVAFLLFTAVVITVVTPAFFAGDSLVLNQFGGGERAVSERAEIAFTRLGRWETTRYLLGVFWPFLFLPFLTRKLVLLSVPMLAANVVAGTVGAPYRTVLPHAVLAVLFVYGFHRLRHVVYARFGRKKEVAVSAIVLCLAVPFTACRDTLFRIKTDGKDYFSPPRYQRELQEALAGVREEDVLSVSTKLAPYVVKNEAYIFPKPFGDASIGPRVSLVILSRHHPSYLDNFNGNVQLFRQYMAQWSEKHRFDVVHKTNDVLVLRRATGLRDHSFHGSW